MIPGLYAGTTSRSVQRIIESAPHSARFVAGMVTSRAGALRAEIDAGAWYALESDAALVMSPHQGL